MRRGLSRHSNKSSGNFFSPLSLFAGGVNGVWYDPSDSSTLFEDTAGTTPSPTPGAGALSVVGLMLDKSQGLALGTNVIVNPTFTTDTWWLKDAGVTISGGTANWAATAATFQIYNTGILTVGALYKVTFTITSISSGGLRAVAGSGTVGTTRTAPGTYTEYLLAVGSGTVAIQSVGASTTASVDDVSYQAVAGNHAISYNTTTARPELSARVNLLTYSEQFDNAAWTRQTNVTISANTTATTDPLGGNTADKIISAPAGTGAQPQQISQTSLSLSANTTYTFSVYVKAAGWNYAFFSIYTGAVNLLANKFNLATGQPDLTYTNTAGTSTITDAGNGWYRIVGTFTTSTAVTVAAYVRTDSGAGNTFNWTGNGVDGVYAWGADLRPANIGTSVPTYQRIADQYTYDSSGFSRYLKFDGIDDGMYTPANLNLSGTDKVTVFAGVRKQSDAAQQAVIGLGNFGSVTGAFELATASGGGANYLMGLRGTSSNASWTYSTYAAPITNVLASSLDLAAAPASKVSTRINAAVNAGTWSTADAGTGNFSTNPLNIGARNAQSGTPILFFNGYIYSLIVVGAASTAAQISSTESWINVKEGGVY